MSDEFRRTAPNTVVSVDGFSVEVNLAGGIKFVDHEGEVQIDSELLVKPYRILLYPPGPDPVALERFERILPNLRRALDYLEYRSELW
jgi:hypothetical protein